MSALRAYAQLVRLPNLPTALADITLAALATTALPDRWAPFVVLLLASSCLYLSGMAFNDVFDVAEDRRDRPERPIPSGRVPCRAAAWLGAVLMTTGLALATLAGWLLWRTEQAASMVGPPLLAGLLATAILLYDGWLKRTALGPVAMGSCRFLNMLLGVSLSGSLAWPLGPHLALVIGLYIVGVTWFARTEATTSRRPALAGAAAVMLTALLLALPLAVQVPPERVSVLFPYLLVALGYFLALPIRRALRAPTPANVQSAVKRSLMGLILLDAVCATATAGTVGLVVLVLLIPSIYLNRRRWLYAT